ncbi:hypothetical protein [Streptomyces avermitilis]|uniref:hypothetical protein n=1 Tax=Streptomyces avermitilis TaxID=33903 RepID=UPI0033DB425B
MIAAIVLVWKDSSWQSSYDDEAPVLHELHHTYLAANGLRPSGLHHEIYLSAPAKPPPRS